MERQLIDSEAFFSALWEDLARRDLFARHCRALGIEISDEYYWHIMTGDAFDEGQRLSENAMNQLLGFLKHYSVPDVFLLGFILHYSRKRHMLARLEQVVFLPRHYAALFNLYGPG